MKTITFYSYKGGVGRTLSLINIANLLAEFGKKVCIIDFDLEAPGIDHKYKNHLHSKVEKGLVDYIYEFAVNNRLVDSIKPYSVAIDQNRLYDITLIPAGNTLKSEYWKKLSHISWWNLFYEDNSEGILFFLDLKEKIKKELSPDYLLIDTRTGITEISGITISILADDIAFFAANNDENMCGIQQMIRTISKEENNLMGTDKSVHFALTRIPLPQTPEERSRESEIKNLVREKIGDAFGEERVSLKSFNVIHSDRSAELFGSANLCYNFNNKGAVKTSIVTEYLTLFESLVKDTFSSEDKEKLDIFINAKKKIKNVYDNFDSTLGLLSELDLIDKLIPNLPDCSFLRGYYYFTRKEYGIAKEQFENGIDKDDSGRCLFFFAQCNFYLKDYDEASKNLRSYIDKHYIEYRVNAYRDLVVVKEYLGENKTKLIVEISGAIEKYPYYSNFYNIRSCLYLKQEEYSSALKDILKAIELEEKPLYYLTLAEIKYFQENKPEFFWNLDTALKKGYKLEDVLSEDEFTRGIYRKVSEDEEFIRVLDRNQQTSFLDLLKSNG